MFRLSGGYNRQEGPRLTVGVIPGRELTGSPEDIPRFEGLLDTGATQSCISPEVAKRLQLEPIGIRPVQSATGVSLVSTYSVSIVVFPESDPVTALCQHVNAAEFTPPRGLDVLIGLDIISQGTLVVTRDTFVFAIPGP